MLGNPCEMNKILKISKKRKIPILEDACESLGSKYNNKFVGTLGDVGVFSLDFGKIITTGEGGLIVSNKKILLIFAKNFMIMVIKIFQKNQEEKIQKIWGLNLRMNELQAAVGSAQLSKLNYIIKKNKQNKKYLKKDKEK